MRKSRLMDLIAVIDDITGDDFCEELELLVADDSPELTQRERIAHNKLSMIYKLAHGFNERNQCYPVHDDWREMLSIIEIADEASKANQKISAQA